MKTTNNILLSPFEVQARDFFIDSLKKALNTIKIFTPQDMKIEMIGLILTLKPGNEYKRYNFQEICSLLEDKLCIEFSDVKEQELVLNLTPYVLRYLETYASFKEEKKAKTSLAKKKMSEINRPHLVREIKISEVIEEVIPVEIITVEETLLEEVLNLKETKNLEYNTALPMPTNNIFVPTITLADENKILEFEEEQRELRIERKKRWLRGLMRIVKKIKRINGGALVKKAKGRSFLLLKKVKKVLVEPTFNHKSEKFVVQIRNEIREAKNIIPDRFFFNKAFIIRHKKEPRVVEIMIFKKMSISKLCFFLEEKGYFFTIFGQKLIVSDDEQKIECIPTFNRLEEKTQLARRLIAKLESWMEEREIEYTLLTHPLALASSLFMTHLQFEFEQKEYGKKLESYIDKLGFSNNNYGFKVSIELEEKIIDKLY